MNNNNAIERILTLRLRNNRDRSQELATLFFILGQRKRNCHEKPSISLFLFVLLD